MDTKSSLLQIGLDLFSKAPYEAVSVLDIVSRANVTKPTLYHHFGSKLGFYQHVFNTYASPFIEQLMALSHYENDLIQNLNQIALTTCEFTRQHPEVYKMIAFALHISKNSEHHQFVVVFWRRLCEAFDQMFRDATPQHGNMAGKSTQLAWSFLYALLAQAEMIIKCPESYQPDVPYRLVKQFMYGIFS